MPLSSPAVFPLPLNPFSKHLLTATLNTQVPLALYRKRRLHANQRLDILLNNKFLPPRELRSTLVRILLVRTAEQSVSPESAGGERSCQELRRLQHLQTEHRVDVLVVVEVPRFHLPQWYWRQYRALY